MNQEYQQELAKRAENTLPFEDERLVSGVVKTIIQGMEKIRQGSGSVIFPESLSLREQERVIRALRRSSGNLVYRIEAFCPLRLQEGVGTEILIREKRRKS